MDPTVRKRFEKCLNVPLPNEDERVLILQSLSKNKPLDDDVDLVAIARSEACAGFSGADLKALINEAAIVAVSKKIKAAEAAAAATAGEGASVSSSLSPSNQGSMPHTIKAVHFEKALRRISLQKQPHYQLQESFKRS